MERPNLTDFKSLEEYCLAMATSGGTILETEDEINDRHKKERERRAEESVILAWEYKIYKSGLPKQFEHPDREWIPEKGTEDMVQAVNDYEKDFDDNISGGMNLIIIGGQVGTGKTRAISRPGFRALRLGIDIFFIDDKELASRLGVESYEQEPDREEMISRCKKVTVLMLDDYGDGKYTPNAESRRDQIIAYRWLNKKPILLTGNWSDLADMKEKTPERIYSRLHERSIIGVNISKRDMRLEGK